MKIAPVKNSMKTLSTQFFTIFAVSGTSFVLSPDVRADDVDGGQIYNQNCAICHKSGLNAAPKFGNKALWAKRIAQGKETVYNYALNGLRGMPPRGGNSNLTDEEVKAAVDYMVGRSGGWGDN